MKQLGRDAFRRARGYLVSQARPLERALFAHEFEGAPPRAPLEALAAFRNPDGGFGRALEPDLRMADSAALHVMTGLDVLRELHAGPDEPLVRGAIAWLVERFDPAIPGWRCVPPDVDAHPHAPHWNWELHRPGGAWDALVIPGARLLSHLSHWRQLCPQSLLESLTRAFVKHVTSLTPDKLGPDSVFYTAMVEDDAVRAVAREMAQKIVTRDPAAWLTYSAKPLKLAPTPDSALAECLAKEVQVNLDWEIDQQLPDGSWLPNWTWQGTFPADWEIARREWQGEVTLRTLRSLRAYGRIESP